MRCSRGRCSCEDCYRRHGLCRYGVGRNDGIDAANGKWVMFLDADDEYLPDAVEEMVRSAQKCDAQAVFAGLF